MSSDKSSKLTIFSNKRKQNEPPIPIIKEKSMEKKDLKPAGVFKYFEEICQVPRPSKKEEKIIAYLKAFGAKHNLETNVDEAGNVLIKKPATPGKENFQTVILQSHIDMVCEKNNDVQHDFLTDPIETEMNYPRS